MSLLTGQPRLEEALAQLAAATGTDAPAWIDTARRLAAAGFMPWQLDLLAGYGPQTAPPTTPAAARTEAEGVNTHG